MSREALKREKMYTKVVGEEDTMSPEEAMVGGINSSHPPVDTNNLAYAIMFYEGIGNLLPWNAFITAAAYFKGRFCGTPLEDSFENYFSFSFTISQTIGLAISIGIQDRLTLKSKVVYPLIVYSLLFALTTGLVAVSMDATALFWITLLTTVLCGLCGATLSGGLYGLGAMLPPAYIAAVMSGNGLAGLVVSMSSLLTTWGGGQPESFCSSSENTSSQSSCVQSTDFSALAYFCIATFVLLSCAVLFLFLQKLPFTQYYLMRADNNETSNPSFGDCGRLTDPLIRAEDTLPSGGTVSALHKGNGSTTAINQGNDNDDRTFLRSVSSDNNGARKLSLSEKLKQPLDVQNILRVCRIVKTPALSVICVFAVTISIFPSLFVLIESDNKCKTSNRFTNDLFTPLLFLFFNLFDFIGRVSAGYFTPYFTSKNVWMPAVTRLLFLPLFLLCNVSASKLPNLFKSDVFPLLFCAAFALTNGYVGSCCMMLGGAIVNPTDASLAGTIMIFSLTLGLFLGACCSFMVVYVGQGGF